MDTESEWNWDFSYLNSICLKYTLFPFCKTVPKCCFSVYNSKGEEVHATNSAIQALPGTQQTLRFFLRISVAHSYTGTLLGCFYYCGRIISETLLFLSYYYFTLLIFFSAKGIFAGPENWKVSWKFDPLLRHTKWCRDRTISIRHENVAGASWSLKERTWYCQWSVAVVKAVLV